MERGEERYEQRSREEIDKQKMGNRDYRGKRQTHRGGRKKIIIEKG
jgi:hypothetical protein